MKLYISNMAGEVTEDDLRQAFGEFGKATFVSITKDSFGDSTGFGFVEMPSKAEAQSAISSLNGRELKNRALNVQRTPSSL